MSRGLALITGGTSGIGLGIAAKLAANNDLALVYASDDTKAAAAVESLRRLEPSAAVKVFRRALESESDCAGAFAQVCETFGDSPSILVNSAGRLRDGLFLSADFADFAKIVNEHLVLAAAMSHAAINPMYRKKYGRIVNLSSISGSYAKRGQTNYASAKAGLEAFTRTLALEVAHRGITVNAIAPGLIETPMTKEMIARIEADDAGIKKRVPVGRAGRPEEVGSLAAFLCSPEASYITGSVVTIDGGRSLGDCQS